MGFVPKKGAWPRSREELADKRGHSWKWKLSFFSFSMGLKLLKCWKRMASLITSRFKDLLYRCRVSYYGRGQLVVSNWRKSHFKINLLTGKSTRLFKSRDLTPEPRWYAVLWLVEQFLLFGIFVYIPLFWNTLPIGIGIQ